MAGAFGLHLREEGDDLSALADELVRLADDQRARRVTAALAAWRESERLGMTATEGGAIRSILRGDATLLIVHDDPEDRRSLSGARLVDDAVHQAMLAEVPTVVVPDVADGRGPLGGIGVILHTTAG